MGKTDEQHQKDYPDPSGSNLAIREVTRVADDLILGTPPSIQVSINSAEPKPNSYTVEVFRDEALITTTELLYGQTAYSLKDIDSLQILKLHRRRSIFQKKLSNFIAGIVATVGCILLLSSHAWFMYVLDVTLVIGSISYVIYFNWWVEQRRRGEFGLVMTIKHDVKVVITSHSLKAIQTLYQILFRRLDKTNSTDDPLVVNMYTGEVTSNCP